MCHSKCCEPKFGGRACPRRICKRGRMRKRTRAGKGARWPRGWWTGRREKDGIAARARVFKIALAGSSFIDRSVRAVPARVIPVGRPCDRGAALGRSGKAERFASDKTRARQAKPRGGVESVVRSASGPGRHVCDTHAFLIGLLVSWTQLIAP